MGFLKAFNDFRSKAQVWNKEVFGSIVARKEGLIMASIGCLQRPWKHIVLKI